MSKVIILKGLPASGKSTWAKEWVKADPLNSRIRINKDDLRDELHNGVFSKKNEREVIAERDKRIRSALATGWDVVVDDTNFNPVHIADITKIAQEFKAEVELKMFDIDPEVAIKRDLKRSKSVGERVIMRMYNRYLKPAIEPYKQPEGKPECIIVDIDGTLAHMDGRSPYDWSKVGTDRVDAAVHYVVDMLRLDSTLTIILLSGRDAACRDITEKWLKDNGVAYDHLYMREMGDMRDDRIVKKELFDEHIRGKFRVIFVLDDRNKVVKMWREEIGLKVLQVAEGDF